MPTLRRCNMALLSGHYERITGIVRVKVRSLKKCLVSETVAMNMHTWVED